MIEIDATRLLCPMPVIRLQNTIKTLKSHDDILIRCTDPGTLQDIPTWCRLYGHTVAKIEERDDEIHFTVKIFGGTLEVQ
jgi:tRNA 2-thiouridine synthesizing protein A